MRVLALDTTTRAGSVALVNDDAVVEERAGDSTRAHAERLPSEIQALLEDCGLSSADVDLFAVAAGPGSFTGLRIGIATQQGLAFVHRRKMAGISALDALAHIAARDDRRGWIGAWMDARRRDVFSALYRVADGKPFESSRLTTTEDAHVGDPAETMERWRRIVGNEPIVVIGDGAVAFSETIRAASPRASILEPSPLAGAIGRLAVAQARKGATVDPAAVMPLYVRRPDAEIDRERRARMAERPQEAPG